jgi:SAM-dependent methyltransferase
MARDARDVREGPVSPCPVRCASCGLVFIDPVPPASIDPKTYGSEYYEPWRHPREERARAALWKRRLHQVARRTPVSTLLDVGCGDGHFLQIARDSGWAVEGIEFSPTGARHAAERLGRPIALGDLSRENLLRGPFEVVTLWHVLEHLPDAQAMIEAVRGRMAPGGLLVVAVPNLDNLLMRAAYRLARFRPLPLFEAGAREPHLNHFDAATLTRALVQHRFSDIEIRPDRCALTLVKRVIDTAAAIASRFSHHLLTDAIVAYARAPQ